MIINYTNYYDQTQMIGLMPILEYSGAIIYAEIIAGQEYKVVGRTNNFKVVGRTNNFKVVGRTNNFKVVHRD